MVPLISERTITSCTERPLTTYLSTQTPKPTPKAASQRAPFHPTAAAAALSKAQHFTSPSKPVPARWVPDVGVTHISGEEAKG